MTERNDNRNETKRDYCKSNIFQEGSSSRMNTNHNSQMKQTYKNKRSNKLISSCLYNITTKEPICNKEKLELVIETISNLKRQRESSSKKRSKPETESSEHNYIK